LAGHVEAAARRFRHQGAALGDGVEQLSSRQQEAARVYMRRRLLADELLDACKQAHIDLHRAGIAPEPVERYAIARDAYEDAVMDFGRAREQLDALLPKDSA
jgi:hypothetical protein